MLTYSCYLWSSKRRMYSERDTLFLIFIFPKSGYDILEVEGIEYGTWFINRYMDGFINLMLILEASLLRKTRWYT